jgi:hypothetical protein
VGEGVPVVVEAHGPAGTVWTFPGEAGDERMALTRVDSETASAAPATGAADPRVVRQAYRATAFALEDVVIPALRLAYRLPDGTTGELATQPVPLRIVSLLPKDADPRRLEDIRGPVAVGAGRAFFVGLAVLLGLAALGLWLWRRQRRRRAPVVPAAAPPAPPDAEALAALDRLAAAGLVERGELRAFYIALAQVAKRYLERRLGAPVLEMTSAELVAFLRRQGATEPLALPLRELTGAADRVKFAREASPAEEAARHLAVARGCVERLEAALRPPAPEAGGQAA